jgi:hypothetical protein
MTGEPVAASCVGGGLGSNVTVTGNQYAQTLAVYYGGAAFVTIYSIANDLAANGEHEIAVWAEDAELNSCGGWHVIQANETGQYVAGAAVSVDYAGNVTALTSTGEILLSPEGTGSWSNQTTGAWLKNPSGTKPPGNGGLYARSILPDNYTVPATSSDWILFAGGLSTNYCPGTPATGEPACGYPSGGCIDFYNYATAPSIQPLGPPFGYARSGALQVVDDTLIQFPGNELYAVDSPGNVWVLTEAGGCWAEYSNALCGGGTFSATSIAVKGGQIVAVSSGERDQVYAYGYCSGSSGSIGWYPLYFHGAPPPWGGESSVPSTTSIVSITASNYNDGIPVMVQGSDGMIYVCD